MPQSGPRGIGVVAHGVRGLEMRFSVVMRQCIRCTAGRGSLVSFRGD
jgi:hypothetical protein